MKVERRSWGGCPGGVGVRSLCGYIVHMEEIVKE